MGVWLPCCKVEFLGLRRFYGCPFSGRLGCLLVRSFSGPRIGKFTADGRIHGIPGHNMTAAFIGCVVLWFGWFGFNPGSTMSIAADGGAMAALSAVNTNIAAAFATMTATATAWLILGKPDFGMTLNGCLAGLVAITAPAYFTNPLCSAIIGSISGVTVVLSVLMFDRLRVDDPVGAISVHLVHGVFGTICVGLFSIADLSGTPITGGPKAGLFFGGGAVAVDCSTGWRGYGGR